MPTGWSWRSSTVVYGAHPDNTVPLTEESPLRANPDFPYAEHTRDVDRWLGQWADRHPEVTVTRLRLATVVGGGVDNFFIRSLLAPRLPSVRGHRPPYQFVHVDDAVAAIARAVEHDLPGAYNVAAEGWLSFDEIAAILGRRALDVPEEVAFSAVERLAATGIWELPVGAVHYVMHPWVTSADRLVATGWRPRHSNRDAAVELARDLGDRLVVGRVATSRRQVRRAAVVGAGVAGGLLALGVLAAAPERVVTARPAQPRGHAAHDPDRADVRVRCLLTRDPLDVGGGPRRRRPPRGRRDRRVQRPRAQPPRRRGGRPPRVRGVGGPRRAGPGGGRRDVAAAHPSVRAVHVAHRIGRLEVGEVSVVCAASAPHRDQALAAASDLIDEVKARVPIWKRETLTDGTVRWPGCD